MLGSTLVTLLFYTFCLVLLSDLFVSRSCLHSHGKTQYLQELNFEKNAFVLLFSNRELSKPFEQDIALGGCVLQYCHFHESKTRRHHLELENSTVPPLPPPVMQWNAYFCKIFLKILIYIFLSKLVTVFFHERTLCLASCFLLQRRLTFVCGMLPMRF